MPYKYATQTEAPHGRAVGRSLPISFKQAVEISHTLRGKPVKKAKEFLQRVLDMKEPVMMFRFNHNIGHRKGFSGPGRYPLKASGHILTLVESAESNATAKGLSADKLYIKNMLAQKGQATMRGGRHRGKAKRTHVEVVVQEAAAEKSEKKKPFKKAGAIAAPKTETKHAEHKAGNHTP